MATSRFARSVVAVTTLSLGALLPPGTAAAADHATLTGTGWYSPGIPVSGCANQDVMITWTMALIGDHLGTYGFTFTGSSDICETVLAGSGSGTLSGDVSGDLQYSRTGNHVAYTGHLTINGDATSVLAWSCTRSYTSALPATSFVDTCQAAFS